MHPLMTGRGGHDDNNDDEGHGGLMNALGRCCAFSSSDRADRAFGRTAEQRIAIMLCVAQAPLFILSIMILPEPIATLFTVRLPGAPPPSTVVTNQTHPLPPPITPNPADAAASPYQGVIHLSVEQYGLAPLFLITSLSAVMFAAITQQLRDQEILDNALEFSEENAAQAGLWTASLWAVALLARLAVLTCLMSPVDYCQLALSVLISLASLAVFCQPEARPHAAFLILGYTAGVMLAWDGIGERHGARVTAFALLVCNDLLLVMGHTYDARPTMLAVGNCRLAYAGTAAGVAWLTYCIAA